MHRKTAMKVQGGQVLRKNNWAAHRDDYHAWTQSEIRLDRRKPAPGFRHLLTVADLRRFLPLLPEWEGLTRGLDAIVLDDDTTCMGWHEPGVVAVCAWERDLWLRERTDAWVRGSERVLTVLGVDRERVAEDSWTLRWTESQARAFQLLDVLPHEMGHHRDHMAGSDSGEPYAERYALKVLDEVFEAYCATFGTP